MSIPRVFHHVWVSGDEMPEEVQARTTDLDRPPPRLGVPVALAPRGPDVAPKPEPLRSCCPISQKADFARYEVVHRFGGIYLDTDMECLRPLETGSLDECEFFAGRDAGGGVAAGIFGAAPSHPIAREMIERLPASCFIHPVEQLATTTGPLLLDRTIRDGGWESTPDVRIFPPEYFYPYGLLSTGVVAKRSLARTRSTTGDTAGRVSEGSSKVCGPASSSGRGSTGHGSRLLA